jgi:hypothetical protein
MEENVINRMQKDIGRMEGKVDQMSRDIAEIKKIIAPIGKHEVHVESMAREVARHGDRIAELERGNVIQKELNVRIKAHLADDVPVDVREGQHAKAVLKWAAVVAGTTIVNQLPRIFALLE